MRKALLQAVYAWLMEGDNPEEVLNDGLDFHAVDPDDRTRARDVLICIMRDRSEADGVLDRVLENWSMDRMGQVELAVCYLALHELRAQSDLPVEVIIDEAVRLGKEYAGDESGHFVNGLLDAAARILRPEEMSGRDPA
ncbi:MAG: transcription antitermination factor NusB [Candidatus Eisenbacteria bacterium]|nr:transcription antitermination factor NusB [Candidatus Eisenbacteria bacterium]